MTQIHEWASFGPHETKKRKGSAQSSKVRKIVGSPRKELGQDTWGFLGAWDPRDMQQSQVGIKTVQGDMPKNTRNLNNYVPIKHLMMQKRNQKAWEPTIHE